MRWSAAQWRLARRRESSRSRAMIGETSWSISVDVAPVGPGMPRSWSRREIAARMASVGVVSAVAGSGAEGAAAESMPRA